VIRARRDTPASHRGEYANEVPRALEVRAFAAEARFVARSRHAIAALALPALLDALAARLMPRGGRGPSGPVDDPRVERELSFLPNHGAFDPARHAALESVLESISDHDGVEWIVSHARVAAHLDTHMMHEYGEAS
jgi:hypothetical protein